MANEFYLIDPAGIVLNADGSITFRNQKLKSTVDDTLLSPALLAVNGGNCGNDGSCSGDNGGNCHNGGHCTGFNGGECTS